MLGKRDAIGEREHWEASRIIFGKVQSLAEYLRADVVLAYSGFGSELQTGPFLRSVLEDGKRLVLPRVNREDGDLDLYKVVDLAQDLEPGTWGISEPKAVPGPAVSLDVVDFALIPGVAFDARGGRLGHGAGYYDRLLGSVNDRPPLVAGAFGVQMVGEVPTYWHDIVMDRILTEKACYLADSDGKPTSKMRERRKL